MAKKQAEKYLAICSIAIFVVLISAPLIFINKNPDKVSVVENKKVEPFPKLFLTNGEVNGSFFTEFEAYINDNIGFKQTAIVSDITVSYKLFNKLKIPGYIMGEDENIFYTSNGEGLKTFQGRNLFTESNMAELCQGFTYMKNYFKSTGADFYLITIPDKEGVYPELYSKEVSRSSDKTRVDRLVEYGKKNTDININNLKEALRSKKGKEMLYYKSHDCSHWNMNGAFVGYTEVMDAIRVKYPQLKKIRKEEFDISVQSSAGSLLHLSKFECINKAMAFEDKLYNYNLKGGYSAELIADKLNGIEFDVSDKYFHYVNKKMADKPKALIIGDSYIYSFLLPIMAESFSELYFINFTSAQQLQEIQKSIKADIVVYEFVERMFDSKINNELLVFQNTKKEDINLSELPFVEDAPVLNIDYPSVENNTIQIDEAQEVLDINGWAVDIIAKKRAKDIYLKVGNNYYLPQYVSRPDLASSNEEYLMAGYKFRIPVRVLMQFGQIEFVIVSNDGTYQYKPIGFDIKLRDNI